MSARFDETIHAPHRLRICAFLDQISTAEFSVVRDMLGVADPVLSKHVKILQEAGYVVVSKPTGLGGRARTWLELTPDGRTALAGHIAAIKELVEH